MYNRIIIIALFICFTGCNTKTKTPAGSAGTSNYTINPDWVYYIEKNESYEKKNLILQDIATVDYIKLETTPDCFLGEVDFFNDVQLMDSCIFITSEFIVFRFDRNGKFLSKITRRGRGPNEYRSLKSVGIDHIKKEVLIYDYIGDKLLKYDYDGKFINSIDLKDVNRIGFLGGDTLACYSENIRTEPAYSLRSSVDGRILKSFSEINQKVTYINQPLYNIDIFRKNRGEFFFNTTLSDTIFSVNKYRRIPRYILLPPNNPDNFKKEGNTAMPHLICETDYFAALSIFKNNSEPSHIPKYYIIDKAQNAVYEGWIRNSDTGTSFRPYSSMQKDNQFVALFDISQLKEIDDEGKLSGKIKELYDISDEIDNPILMIATAKGK